MAHIVGGKCGINGLIILNISEDNVSKSTTRKEKEINTLNILGHLV